MKTPKQGITLGEKLDLIPASLYVFLAGILAMFTGLWRSERDAPSYYLHVAFSVLRSCTERFSAAQMEWALPLTNEVYDRYARSAGVVPRTVELCDGAKGHWVGNPDAKNVLIWYHGGGFAMAANGAFFEFYERLLATARSNGKDVSIFMLTYSLSSQAQYPTQLKQAIEALRYILSHTKHEPDSIVLCGDSAGASLAMGVTSHLAHPHPSIEAIRLCVPLAGVVLMALPPSMDDKVIEERDIYYGGDLLVPDVVLKWRDQYLGGAKRDLYTDPYDAHPSWFEKLPVKRILVLAGGNEVLKPLMEEFVDKVKIHCDASEQKRQCDWCCHQGLPCSFDRVSLGGLRTSEKNGLPLSHHSDASRLSAGLVGITSADFFSRDAHISSASSANLSADPVVDNDDNDQPMRSVSPRRRTETLAPRGHLSNVSFRNSVPYFSRSTLSWIEACTDEKTHLPAIFLTERPHLEQPSTRLARSTQVDLPERRVVEFLMEDYLTRKQSCLYPLIDRALFSNILHQAYGLFSGQVPSEQSIAARACVFAFTAIASLYCRNVHLAALVDSRVCADRAERLLEETSESLDMVTLQTLILLHLHDTYSCRLRPLPKFLIMACRIISAVKANVLTEAREPHAELFANPGNHCRVHLRRLFWVAYILDRNQALYTGQEPLIVDEYCNLSLHDTSTRLQSTHIASSITAQPSYNNNASQIPWLLGNRLQLFLLKSKVLKLLHSVHMMDHRGSQLLSTIRELDVELEEWRASLPAQLRPTLSVARHAFLLNVSSFDELILRMILSLEYYHLLGAIHGASRRYFNEARDYADCALDDGNRLLSCLRICIEASRCTANLFMVAKLEITPLSFWLFSVYFLPAVLALFFNIVENPHVTEAQTDMDIVTAAKITIQEIRFSRLSNEQQEHLKDITGLLAELDRLGKAVMRNV